MQTNLMINLYQLKRDIKLIIKFKLNYKVFYFLWCKKLPNLKKVKNVIKKAN